MTFVHRKIDVTFSLGKGSFGDNGFNTVKVSGLRVSASIERMGLPGMNRADVKIYGLTLSLMNTLSTLGKPLIFLRDNRILIEAGDATAGMATAFQGMILSAWADMSATPQTVFVVQAFVGALEALTPVNTSSFSGSADVATIMSGLATQMKWGFKNDGVNVTLSDAHFPGTARDQVIACAEAANIYVYFDDIANVLSIWPKTGNRAGLIPLISPSTGMQGYPRYTQGGAGVDSIYNPSISFGGQVQIDSMITPAVGTWIVNKLSHQLESEMPGGKWLTSVEGYRLGTPPTLPG